MYLEAKTIETAKVFPFIDNKTFSLRSCSIFVKIGQIKIYIWIRTQRLLHFPKLCYVESLTPLKVMSISVWKVLREIVPSNTQFTEPFKLRSFFKCGVGGINLRDHRSVCPDCFNFWITWPIFQKAYATRGHLNAAPFRFLQVTWEKRELVRRKRRCNHLVHSPEMKQGNRAQRNTHLLLM